MTRAPNEDFVLHAIIDGGDEAAHEVLRSLQLQLEGAASRPSITVRPYWKFPNTTELLVVVKADGTAPRELFDSALLLAPGWEPLVKAEGNWWAIWNRAGGAVFVDARVRWVHVQVV